jgi:hypothetical protein
MNDTNPTNQTRKMLTRDPMLTAFFNIECRNATHCVDAFEDDGEPARVWAMNVTHAGDIAKALKGFGFTSIKIQEA